ncbi:MAG: T9SS type A sorting domain-containing protein [Burkholderiales bacterium]|nr:T9SS type A sorting domain-containing protein [Bacteroidia bacterium]
MKLYTSIILFLLLRSTITNSQTLNYYFGNIHAHSSYSDGNKDSASSLLTTPFQDFNYAKNSQHIDFYGISEHNHLNAGLTSPTIYHQGIRDAKAATTSNFLALYGMEYGVISNGGHVLIYGYDSLLIGWDNSNFDVFNSQYNYATLWKSINKKPSAFAMFAHPANTDYDSLYFKPYNASFDSAIVGTPFRSGPAFSTNSTYSNPATGDYIVRYTSALKKGYHLGIGLDHDTHNSVFGRQTAGRLVVMAPALNQNDLFNAIKGMHFYGSDDWNTKVDFSINGQMMGSVVSHSGTATLSVNITDPDGENTSTIAVYCGIPGSGSNPFVLTSVTNTNTLTYTHTLANNASYYYYLKITQADGDLIYTSPIWYKRNDAVTQYPPVSDFTTANSNTVCAKTFTLTDNSTNSPTSWSWYMPGTTTPISSLQNPVITYTSSGIKNITLIATNASGSGTPVTQTISVNTCTGIQQLKKEQISIYPNPASNYVTISIDNLIEYVNIKLIDVLGNEIVSSLFQKSISQLNISAVPSGIYSLIITDSKNNTFTKLLVVNH